MTLDEQPSIICRLFEISDQITFAIANVLITKESNIVYAAPKVVSEYLELKMNITVHNRWCTGDHLHLLHRRPGFSSWSQGQAVK